MREFVRRFSSLGLDLRVIVAVSGAVLSIAIHELFHIITHWGDINSISLFPDRQTIMEVVFTASGETDLVFEEAVAYGLTMIVLILTAMLVYEIHDIRDNTSVKQAVLTKTFTDYYAIEDETMMLSHLSSILGVNQLSTDEKQ